MPVPHNHEQLEEFFKDPNFDMVTGLQLWDEIQEEAAKYKDTEMMARKAIFKKAFPTYKLGVNNYPLFNGWILKGTGKLNYRIDKEMFPQVSEGLASMDLAIDDYLKVAYSLAEGPYNKIVKDESLNKTVGTVLRQMITSSEGAPTLEIIKPRRVK
jgi:hypothetical protein